MGFAADIARATVAYMFVVDDDSIPVLLLGSEDLLGTSAWHASLLKLHWSLSEPCFSFLLLFHSTDHLLLLSACTDRLFFFFKPPSQVSYSRLPKGNPRVETPSTPAIWTLTPESPSPSVSSRLRTGVTHKPLPKPPSQR
jgi:hypothetical protein